MTPLERLEIRSSFCRVAADVPDMERAGKIAEEAQREAGIDGRMWLEEVRRLLDGGIRRQYADIEIQYLLSARAVCAAFPMRPCAGSPLTSGRRRRRRFCFLTAIPMDAAAICPPQKSMIREDTRCCGPTWYTFPITAGLCLLTGTRPGKWRCRWCGIGRRGIINHHKIIIRAMSASRRQGLSASGHTPAADSPCNGLYDSIVFLHPV